MAAILKTPRRVAPYVISGATSIHILSRMHRLSRQPAADIPLHFFLLKNSDVVLALSGASVVIWHLAKYKPRQQVAESLNAAHLNGFEARRAEKSVIAGVVHELRQVFTALLLGLGLIGRRADAGNTQAIGGMVQRLKAVVHLGIDAVNVLDSQDSANGHEREYGAQ